MTGMTKNEMIEIIGLATENDKFMTPDKQTEGRVQTWMFGLLTEAPDMTFTEAQQAIGYYYARVGKSMGLDDLIRVWEEQSGRTVMAQQLAHDVRWAKKLNLLPADHLEKVALPESAVTGLAEYRAKRAAEVEAIESSYGQGAVKGNAEVLAMIESGVRKQMIKDVRAGVKGV